METEQSKNEGLDRARGRQLRYAKFDDIDSAEFDAYRFIKAETESVQAMEPKEGDEEGLGLAVREWVLDFSVDSSRTQEELDALLLASIVQVMEVLVTFNLAGAADFKQGNVPPYTITVWSQQLARVIVGVVESPEWAAAKEREETREIIGWT